MLSFLTAISLTLLQTSSQQINSCSSFSGLKCTILCDGSPFCQGQTINCQSNFACSIECYYNPDRRRLLKHSQTETETETEPRTHSNNRNLLQSSYSCSGNSYGCCDSVINCPIGQACEIDCTEGCSHVTVNAAQASSLYIKDCNKDNNSRMNCAYMTIYCPRNGRGGTQNTCEIQGDSSSYDILESHIYTEEGLNDLYINKVDTSGTTLHCGKSTTEYSCVLNANGDGCASGQPTTCENFIIPTPEPTPAPTDLPTSSPTSETDAPTTVPTHDPTNDPTEYPTTDPTNDPTGIPTPQPTKNPTFTNNPTTNPTTDPTNRPSVSPTVSTQTPSQPPVRSGNVGSSDEDTEVSYDEANIVRQQHSDNGWVMWLIIVLCIIAVLFFCCVLWSVVKRRRNEEKYDDDFRMQSAQMVYHTVPGGDGPGSPSSNVTGNPIGLAPPKRNKKMTITVTMTGEHMEYNEAYGGSAEPLQPLEEHEEDGRDAVQRRLYYQAQFMEMMLCDPEQQQYLLTLDPVSRKQYIDFQCNLYLSRVEDMARRKTLPMKYGNDNTPTEDSIDDIDNDGSDTGMHTGDEGDSDESVKIGETIGGDEVVIGDSSSDDNLLMYKKKTVGDVDMADSDGSIDEINNPIVEDNDEDIVNTIDTAGGPVDVQPDVFYD